MNDVVKKQLDILISLLARRDPGVEFIHRVVTRGKRDPRAYIRVYNALDGTISVTEAARLAKVSQPTMTGVLQGWQAAGVVYNLGDSRKPLYKSLAALPE